ncbi:Cysteine protease atg4 [Stygiomarasmius scandens]|uniref:Autophagy-related protein 4 n=1 Tax=Marasmiellus scandens TaxID=2682957 RepID=A0ABR1JF05_9AGAR
MSKQHSRHTPSPSSPTPTSNQSKLPKFLQKPSSRDRSRSVNDGSVSSPELSASSSKHPRRSKFLGGAPDKSVPEEPTTETDETPVIVEPSTASTPVSIPRSRPRTDPPSPSYASTSPSSRIGDLPTRLSGWFTHTFSSSTTDLSLPNLLSHPQSHPSNSTSTSSVSSPKSNRLTGASALLTAAKHGKGHLDKAMRYLLDSDATPDKCTDPIWLLGVQHPGYEPPPQVQQPPPSSFPQTGTLGRRGSVTGGTGSPPSSSFRPSSSSEHSHGHTRSKSRGGGGSSFLSQSQPASSSPSSSSFRNPSSSSATSSVSSSSATVQPSLYNSNISGSSTTSLTATAGGTKDPKHPGANWPPVFYADFTSKIWLTYRSHFTPIRDGRLGELQPPACEPILPPPPPHTPGSPRSGKTGSSIKSHGHHHKYNDSYKSDSSSSHYSSNNRGGGPSSPTSTSLSHTSASTGMTGSSTATTSTTSRRWNWGVPGLGGEKGWTSDSGWGCMLRTGQSLLANALLFMHLGRDWRRPPYPELTTSYATYVQIITWFLDTPDPAAPFSVHRMALAGKELGKDVGMWFGPSTAAGAIKTLVHAYPDAGMGVAVATDGVLYQTDVYAASHGSGGTGGYGKRGKGPTTWGHRPVLLLFGIRLGIEGVNPIYYDTIKLLYTFPQSVGIAGGRPSSSYYFVGSQADNLFYLDPHHARPAVPLRPPGSVPPGGPGTTNSDTPGKERDRDREKEEKKKKLKERKQHRSSSGGSWSSTQQQQPVPVPIPGTASPPVTSPTSPTRSSSGFHTPSSPSPLQQQYSSASGTSGSSRFSVSGSAGHGVGISAVERSGSVGSTSVSFSSSGQSYSQSPSRTDSPVSVSPSMSRNNTTSSNSNSNTTNMSDMDYSELIGADEVSASASASVVTDPLQVHYCTAYSAAELKTFHCERVRKMPMSGLDPSMLIGFLCRDEKEWVDLRRRVGELPKSILPILDEPPKWAADSDDNIGLESMSDDEDGLDMPEDEEDELVDPSLEGDVEVQGQGEGEGDADDDSEKYYDSRSRSGSASESPSSAGASQEGGGKQRERQRGRQRGKSEEVDTEEDPVDPITPGPANTRFEIPPMPKSGVKEEEEDKPFVEEDDDDIEDDWVDPSVSSSPPPSTRSPSQSRSVVPDVVPMTKTKSNGSTSGSIKKKKKKKEKQVPVPVPKVRTSSTHGVAKEKESFPFPVAAGGEDVPPEISHSYSSSSSSGALGDQEEVPPSSSSRISNWEGRMHTARARDGGRTQSGGVKGILTDDWVDSDRA